MKNAKEVLSTFLSSSQLLEAGEITEFFSAWEKIAGTNLAAHSRINELEKGIVYIDTDHPGWIQLLKIEERRILKALQQRFPGLGIKGLRFFLRDTAVLNQKVENKNVHDSKRVQKKKTVLAEDKIAETSAKHDLYDGKQAFMQSLKRLEKIARENPRD